MVAKTARRDRAKTTHEARNDQEFAKRLVAWFGENGRQLPWRREHDPYKVLITEKFLAQTDPGHVLKIYDEFFRKYPSMNALAASSESDIEEVIRPIGFWRQRAHHLRKIAAVIAEEYGGAIPTDREELRSIYGIGDYTADAFLCFSHGERRVAVDLNSRRIAQRLWFWPSPIPSDQDLAKVLQRLVPRGKSREFNWALIDFANLVCRRKPKCEICFATGMCNYFRRVISKRPTN